jgi:hypothetical protein
MPSIFSSDAALLIYYGRGGVDRLERYERVALQPGLHTREELALLADAGTRTLAYLSVGEDVGPWGPWQREERNPLWGGHYVIVSHPGWRDSLLTAAERAFELGFEGLFLDTLDAAIESPDGRGTTVDLVDALHRIAGDRALIANRGFVLASDLAPLVEGFVFEGFSTTWLGGYRALDVNELSRNDRALSTLSRAARPVYALDYAADDALVRFARARAASHGLPCQVSDRWLLQIP